MSERFYKIGNTWYPWQTAHGLYGYTKTPTIRITYISTSQATWGQPEGGYGFFDGDASEPQDGSYFHTSTWGWFDADTMAKTVWLMPSECEIEDIFFENDGEISPGARLIVDPNVSIDEEDWRYLIASVRNLGWHTISEWEALGWAMTDPNTLYFGGDFSGNNIRMESVDGGGGLIDKYASYKALFELRGWEPGGLFIDKPRMMEICGVLTETSDSVVLVEVPKQLSVGRIEFTGSLAEGGIPESGVVEEYVPTDYIDVLCGFKYQNGNWVAVTFPNAGSKWWAGVISAEDQAKLQELGLISDTSYPHDEILYSNAYNYECVAMYSDMGITSVQFDPSNFYVDKATSYPAILIFSRAAFSTPVMTWVCRIAPNPEYIDVILAFRWDTSNNEWMSINFNYNPPDDNYWWGCLISSEDSEAVRKYGLKTASADWFGQYGGFLWNDDYTFQAIEVYSELGQPVSGYDLTTLDCYSLWVGSLSKNAMAIRNLVKDTTYLKFWKCRITRKVAPVVKKAYLTTTPHSDKYLNTYREYSIVDENDNHIPYDSSKSYTLIGKYKVDGSVVTGSMSLISGDDGYGVAILKLYNGSPGVEVGYIEYTES